MEINSGFQIYPLNVEDQWERWAGHLNSHPQTVLKGSSAQCVLDKLQSLKSWLSPVHTFFEVFVHMTRNPEFTMVRQLEHGDKYRIRIDEGGWFQDKTGEDGWTNIGGLDFLHTDDIKNETWALEF